MISNHTDPALPDVAGPAFKALSDPTRRKILTLLAEQDMTIGEVVDRFDMTRAGVKKHLNLLRHGRLITVTPRGRERLNAISPEGFQAVSTWLGFFDRFWDNRLAALKSAAEKEHGND